MTTKSKQHFCNLHGFDVIHVHFEFLYARLKSNQIIAIYLSGIIETCFDHKHQTTQIGAVWSMDKHTTHYAILHIGSEWCNSRVYSNNEYENSRLTSKVLAKPTTVNMWAEKNEQILKARNLYTRIVNRKWTKSSLRLEYRISFSSVSFTW